MNKLVIYIAISLFALGIVSAETSVFQLTKGYADTLYCTIIGGCPGGASGSSRTGAEPYLYNDSTFMYFNDTTLNNTIDNRAGGTNVNGTDINVFDISARNINMRKGNITNLTAAEVDIISEPYFTESPLNITINSQNADFYLNVNDDGTIRRAMYVDSSATACMIIGQPDTQIKLGETILINHPDLSGAGSGFAGFIWSSIDSCSSYSSNFMFGEDTRFDQGFIGLHADSGNQLIIGDVAAYNNNYDHPIQTQPTLYLNTVTDPDTDNTQWLSFQHNTTDAKIDVGKGSLYINANVVTEYHNISGLYLKGNGSNITNIDCSQIDGADSDFCVDATGGDVNSSLFVNITGDTMTGNLNMSTNNISNLQKLTFDDRIIIDGRNGVLGAGQAGYATISIGSNGINTGDYNVLMGKSSGATGDHNVVIGEGASATNDFSVAIGKGAVTSAYGTTRIGNGGGVSAIYSSSIGSSSFVYGARSAVFGYFNIIWPSLTDGAIFGSTNNLNDGTSSFIFGKDNSISGSNNLIFGSSNNVTAQSSAILGTSGKTMRDNTLLITYLLTNISGNLSIDGNYFGNGSNITNIDCSQIDGADSDFCVDATGGGGFDGTGWTNTSLKTTSILNVNITQNLTIGNNFVVFDTLLRSIGINTHDLLDTFNVNGSMDLVHIATHSDDHAFEIDVDAKGFGDVKAIDIVYTTGAIVTGEDEEAILINFDESLALGGTVVGLEIITTEGLANIYGLEAGALVSPILQLSGTFENSDSGLVNNTNSITAFTSQTNDSRIFSEDNGNITIGFVSKFEEIEILFNTTSSGAGISPEFYFSNGTGVWVEFFPADGTNGMRNNGVIVWTDGDIPDWSTGLGSEYLIQIVRTRNNIVRTPIESLIKIAAVTEYWWNKTGDLNILSAHATNIDIDTNLTFTSPVSIRDNISVVITRNGSNCIIIPGETSELRIC